MVATTGIAIELQDKTKQGARAITRSLDDIKKSARETATSVDKLDDNFDRLKDELKETGRSADKAGREFDQLAGKAKKASDATGGMGRNFTALKGAFAAVGTSVVVKQFFDLLDVSTQINNRLKLVTDSTYALGLAQQQLFEVSQKSRVGFDQTVDLYSRLARSSEELGLTQRELVDITETISQAITISGASADAASAALLQLGQGIASGTLRGEELNSVLEQTPRLARAIADGMGVSIGQLRALGAEGVLTSETVVKAIQTQQGAVRTEFGQTSATIGQSMTKVTNSLTKLVSEIDKSAKISDSLASSLSGVADQLDRLSDPKSVERGVVEQIGNLIFDTPLFKTLSIFTAPSRGDTPSNATTAPFFTLLSGISDFFESEEPKARNALTGYLNTLKAQQDLRDQREKELEEAEHIFNEKQLVIDREFNQKLPDILDEAAQNIERGIDGLLPARVRAASYRPSTGPRVAERGPTLLGPVAVDERVFSFERNLKNVSTAREIESAAIDATIDALRRISPELAEFADAGQDIYDAFTSGNVAAQITSVANGLFLLLDTFFGISDSGEKARRALEDLNRALEQADRSAQSVIESLFFEDIAQGQQRIFTVFEDFFALLNQGAIDIGGATGLIQDLPETQADAVRRIFDILAEFDVLGVGKTLEEFEVSRSFSQRRFVAAVEASFGSFDEFEKIFLQTFGDTGSFAEVATQFFDTSEAFDHLRDSAEDATSAVDRLSAAEQAATRLRINAQEIALRTQLSQEFRRAGSDVFEQRAAYNRFQQAVRQLQYMGRAGAALTGGGGGASASTTAATTTATGGTAATTTAAQVTTTTTQPLTVDYSGDNLVIIRKEIDHWDQLLYGPVWDGTEKPEIDFNGSHKLHVWKRLINDYDQMFYGPVWDGREKPEIDFDGSHKLHIWRRKIDDYDQMFYGPVYDGREKLPVNFGNRIQITGKYALDDWSDIFRGWLISNNTQESGFRSIEKNFGTPGFVKITGKYALDDWSDIFRGWLISKNTQEAGFRPLEYDFGTPGFVEITGKAQFAIDQLIGLSGGSGFDIEMQYLKDNNLFNVTPADFTINDLFKFSIGNPIEIDMGFLKSFNLFKVLPAVVSVPELIQLDTTRLIEINLASIIDFNASGLSEAINSAVKEAIGDRSYDEPQRLGYTSGRA
jgi:tape measure domain-containing protein